MSQQFCLKWNNHTTNMLQVFESLLTTEALVDVTLACDGLSLKAHKMVLSACSPFFQSLFLENPCKHPIVIMKDMRYCDLKAIIDFMYRGEVNVSHDQLSALLKTAETLKVKGLAEVTGENKQASGIVQQEIIQQNASTPTSVPPSAQRTDTPPLQGKRKRGRPRKRSLSDSNRSDDEGVPPKIKEPNSDIEELSGDASMEATSDNRSGGGPVSSNSQSQVPIHSSNNVNTFSKSHLSTSQDPQVEEPASGDENEFEVEPSKLLEQTLTTENVPSNSQNSTGHITLPSVSGLEISRRSMSSTDSVSQALVPVSIPSDSLGSNLQGPDSPQDVKPQILSFDDPPISPVAGTSHGSDRSLMMYMDQSGVASIPGPSNFQDNSALVPHDSQPQGVHGRGNISNSYKSNRMCETTRLLKELKEDPVCLCHSSNSGLLEVPMENELSSNVQKENMKCLKRSKQLLIYNEEGCMKGLELNKGIVSDASTNLNDLQLSANYIPILQDGTTFVEDEYCSNRNFQSNNSTIQSIERNLSFLYKPRNNNDTTESDARETGNQSYTHYTVMEKPVEKNRPVNKSGQRKSAKRQSKKSHSTSSSLTDLHSGNEHSVPCTVLEKQSYTQVSVEEVHVAQNSSGIRRPRRNITKKSASEMLMLKRKIKKKIVQSTSIEYQAQSINQDQYSSNEDTKISVLRSQKAEKQKKISKGSPNVGIQGKVSRSSQNVRTLKKVSRKSRVKDVVKKKSKISTLSADNSTELEKYGPALLPPGWNRKVLKRKSGKTAGQIDVYFVTPEGKRLRSRIEIAAYLLKNRLPFSADEFCFRKSAYKNMLSYNTTI